MNSTMWFQRKGYISQSEHITNHSGHIMTISIVLDLIVRVVYERQNEMWKDSTEDDDDNGRQVITIAHKAFSQGSYKINVKHN